MKEVSYLDTYSNSAQYQITVLGKISTSFLSYWDKMQLSHSKIKNKNYSVLTGEVRDQAALNGILNILYDNHFSLVSIIKLEK